MKRRVIAGLLAAMLVGFSALNVFTAADMGRVWGDRAVCSIGSATDRDLSLLAVLYPDLEWTAYAQSGPQTLVSGEFPTRTAEAAVLSFLGAPDRIAFFPLISGRLPQGGELGACALDASTAYELFKSTSVAGNSVRLGEKSVRVVGVVDERDSIASRPSAARRRNRVSCSAGMSKKGRFTKSASCQCDKRP